MDRRPPELRSTVYATDSGRRRRLADTRASKQVQDPQRGGGMITVFKSEDAIEDERWVYILEVKSNVQRLEEPPLRRLRPSFRREPAVSPVKGLCDGTAHCNFTCTHTHKLTGSPRGLASHTRSHCSRRTSSPLPTDCARDCTHTRDRVA